MGTGGRIEVRAIDVSGRVHDRDQHAPPFRSIPAAGRSADEIPTSPLVTPQKGLGGVPVGTPYDDGKVKASGHARRAAIPTGPPRRTTAPPPASTFDHNREGQDRPESRRISTREDHVLSSSKERGQRARSLEEVRQAMPVVEINDLAKVGQVNDIAPYGASA